MTGPELDDVYDLRGFACPLPVLKTRKRLATMRPGALLWIETNDPLAVVDIPAFCQEAGHRLVETAAVGGGNRFLIERCEEKSGSDRKKSDLAGTNLRSGA